MRLLYSCGLSRGHDHYLGDSELFYVLSEGNPNDLPPQAYTYDDADIIIIGKLGLEGDYSRPSISPFVLRERYYQLFKTQDSKAAIEALLLEYKAIEAATIKAKYPHRFMFQ